MFGSVNDCRENPNGNIDPVRPGVHANLMSSHVLFDQNGGPFNDTRTDDKESSSNILLVQVIEQVPAKINEDMGNTNKTKVTYWAVRKISRM
jgi:hypothetical protein